MAIQDHLGYMKREAIPFNYSLTYLLRQTLVHTSTSPCCTLKLSFCSTLTQKKSQWA